MKELSIEKVTVNIGVGEHGEKLQKATSLLSKLTGREPIQTKARKREQSFGIKKGEEIGAKVTLRGKNAVAFLKKAFEAVDGKIKIDSFDKFGNFSFGIKEYIDFPGMRYDPSIGLIGFDVCVTLSRPGRRVELRRRKRAKIPVRHLPTREEAIDLVKKMGANVYES